MIYDSYQWGLDDIFNIDDDVAAVLAVIVVAEVIDIIIVAITNIHIFKY